MKILVGLFLCLLLTYPIFSQSKDITAIHKELKSFKHSLYYGAKYDKFKDRSIVICASSVFGGKGSFLFGGALVNFSIEYYFKGEKLNETPTDLIWRFLSYSNGVQNTLTSTTLYVIADGERFEIPEGLRDSNINQDLLGDIHTNTSLIFIVKRENLEKFANAQKLEIEVGDKPYTLKPEFQRVMKDFLFVTKINN